jgi:Carboxypeptidase regulatory-like domain
MTLPRHLGLLALLAIATASGQTMKSAASDPTYRIFGTVVDQRTNQPLAGVRVMISPIAARNSVRTLKTKADGNFLFEQLSRGKFSLSAVRHGYPEQAYEQHENYSTAIAVGPALDSEHIIFRLLPEGTIRGIITDDQNEPVGNAKVSIFRTSVSNGRTSTRLAADRITDDRGYYSYPHLLEGQYYVAAIGQPWYNINSGYVERARTLGLDSETIARLEEESSKLDLVYPLTFYSGTQSAEDATPLQVGTGESVDANLVLHTVRGLHLRISSPAPPEPTVPSGDSRDGSGSITLSGTNRYFLPPTVHVMQSVFEGQVVASTDVSPTAKPGEYEVTGLAPGHYIVAIDRLGDTAPISTTQELDLTSDVALPTSSGTGWSNVSGVVSSNIGLPPQSFVRLTNRALGRFSYGAVIRDGKFTIEQPVPPGSYELGVGGPPGGRFVKSISANGAKVIGRTIQIDNGKPIQISIDIAESLVQIDGITVKNGKPFAGAMVLLVPDDLEHNFLLLHRDQSDSDGTFTFGPTVPGKYKALAIREGWNLSWTDPKVLAPFLKKALEINVTGTATMNVKLEVQ